MTIETILYSYTRQLDNGEIEISNLWFKHDGEISIIDMRKLSRNDIIFIKNNIAQSFECFDDICHSKMVSVAMEIDIYCDYEINDIIPNDDPFLSRNSIHSAIEFDLFWNDFRLPCFLYEDQIECLRKEIIDDLVAV